MPVFRQGAGKMKKFSLMALALGLFLAAANAMAAGTPSGLQDSTWLAKDTVMSKQVGQPNSGVPLGSIIVWSNAGMPADSTNWRECDGQPLGDTAVCKRLGICTAPNYKGYFLRGYGGNSGALGVEQEAKTSPHRHIVGRVSNQWGYDSDGYGSYIPGREAGTTTYGASHWDGWESWQDIYSSLPYEEKATKQNENRPINKAVRYLIKVN